MPHGAKAERGTAAVNAFCFYFGRSTWALHARAFLRALHQRRPVRIIPLEPPTPNDILSAADAEMLSGPIDETLPAIGIGSVESMQSLRGPRRIAFVVFETTHLPSHHRTILREMSEVWTPSTWGRDTLVKNGLDPTHVFTVPEGVDTEFFHPAETPTPHKRFRFLCVGKWETRKSTADLVRCFAEEFSSQEDVELVLHAHNPWLTSFSLEREIAAVLGHEHPHARIIASPPVSAEQLRALYRSSDAFVLPTRGEGWGLPLLEAMACGLPVIATHYSAPADYLDDSVGYPLRVSSMVAVHDPLFFTPGVDHGLWAQPDLAHLRQLMRHTVKHREETAAKGRLARAAVCSRWTWDHAAALACDRLDGNP
jgi:glycosyltransferase involved in cell wall biosynthesis